MSQLSDWLAQANAESMMGLWSIPLAFIASTLPTPSPRSSAPCSLASQAEVGHPTPQ